MPHAVEALVREINRAWQEGRTDTIEAALHPEVVMVLPGFAGRTKGARAMVAGFEEFLANAMVLEFEESELEVDEAGDCAVASYRFRSIYELDGRRYRSTGRDLWVFVRIAGAWKATWRTMIDTEEDEIEGST